MGGSSFSRVKINAREIALSADQIRTEQLLDREVQNLLGWGSADAGGTPFSALLRPLTLTPIAATFTMTLSDGDAFYYNPTDVSLTVDDSPYEVIRWRSLAPLTFATPDATNPRIDLVVATPGMVDTDLASRNILVDPSARTISAQNVNKTSNPTSAIAVVTGTPAGSPVPPAVPAGAVALLEVLVPAAAPDSGTFFPLPRLSRRAEYPWSTASGIISGCRLGWDLTVDAASASTTLSMAAGTNLLMIDGEVLDVSSFIPFAAVPDTSNNPFGASPSSDLPYYVYAVGGRHSPQGTAVLGGLVPIALIESLTPPDLGNYGRPTASLVTPRGTAPAAACVYVGIGYVQGGTTHRKPCIMDDEWVYIVGADSGFTSHTLVGTGVQALGTLASRPSISRKVLGIMEVNATALAEVHLHPDRGDGAGAAPTSVGSLALNVGPVVKSQVAGITAFANVVFFFNPANPKIWIGGSNLTNGDSIGISAQAYDHRVGRIVGG